MAMNMEEIRSRLSSIEGDAQMYVDFGDDEVPQLVELLDDEEAWMAQRAVYALARIATPNALAALERASDSSRPEVRVACATSANLLPAEAADRVLTKLLTDREVGVRKFAVESVTPDNEDSVRQLVAEMTDADDDALRAKARTRARELGY